MAQAGAILRGRSGRFAARSGQYRAEGTEGLQDRQIGRLSARAVTQIDLTPSTLQ